MIRVKTYNHHPSKFSFQSHPILFRGSRLVIQLSCATSPLHDKLPALFWVWHAASYMAVCCSTQRTLEFSWPCPSHRGLGRTLCWENIALGTSPQSLKQRCWCQGTWSDFILCHLTEVQVGSQRAGGGVKRGSIRLTKKVFWLQIAAPNAC